MNYFEFYPGDYQRDTNDLSLMEHGAFLTLLSVYYSTEEPLDAPLAVLERICRAMTPKEKTAVKTVANRFFPVASDGRRHNSRADLEIEKARRRIQTSKANGSKGGRPAKANPAGNPAGNPTGNPSGTRQGAQQQTRSGEALQTPDPITPDTPPGRSDSVAPTTAGPTEPGRACLLMRQAGCTLTNPNHPDLLAAIAEGITPEALASAAAEALELGKQRPFAYAIATARSRKAEGPKAVATTGVPHVRPRPESRPARLQRELEDIARVEAEQRQQHAEPRDDAEALAVDVGPLLGQVVKRIG